MINSYDKVEIKKHKQNRIQIIQSKPGFGMYKMTHE